MDAIARRWPKEAGADWEQNKDHRVCRQRFAVSVSAGNGGEARHQAASVASSIGSTIDGSSFSGLLTRVDIGHIRIRSAGNGRIRSRGSGSSLSQRV